MTFAYPGELYYRDTHEWIDSDDREARVGITDFAQDELGDIVFVELPEVGARLDQGDQFGAIESIKAMSELYVPVGGEVVAVNDTLESSPELVNDDPYGDGWLIELAVADEGEFEALLDAAAYRDQVE